MQINGNSNVFEQIVNHYRKYITLGVMESGEKMPSCRELAVEIGVNHKTVERAYAELVKEGLIESIPKKGFFVVGEKKKNPLVKELLLKLKDNGITKEELEEALIEIFGEVKKWLN